MMSAPHGNLYCRGFSPAFGEADLLALFGPFGEVTSCRLVSGEQQATQAAPHAFVRFATPEQASRAVGAAIRLPACFQVPWTSAGGWRGRVQAAAPLAASVRHPHSG